MASEQVDFDLDTQRRIMFLAESKDYQPGALTDGWQSPFPKGIGTIALEDMGVELFGRKGIITPDQTEQAKTILEPIRQEFEELPRDAQDTYLKYLGKNALSGIKGMQERTKDTIGTDMYSYKFKKLERFVGFVLSRYSVEPLGNLSNVI